MYEAVFRSFENTKVRTLPTAGLQTLTTLKAQNVPTMTRFPDIFQLRRLRKAELTYSYHCCAINAEYGFGHLNKNGKSYDDGVTKYYCDTGELYVEKKTWWNEADFDEESEPVKIISNSTNEPLKLNSGEQMIINKQVMYFYYGKKLNQKKTEPNQFLLFFEFFYAVKHLWSN